MPGEPRSEDEIAMSLLMTNRRMPMPALESLSEAMLRGENRLVVDEKTLELMQPAVQGAQRMLGIALKNG